MPVAPGLDEGEGDVRFHHLTPDFWVLEARRSSKRWVIFHETYSFCLVTKMSAKAAVPWRYNHRLYVADLRHAMIMQPGELHANVSRTPPADFIVVQVSESLMKKTARTLGWKHRDLNIAHPHPGSGHPAILGALRRIQRGLCTNLFGRRVGQSRCLCARDLERHLENLTSLVAALITNCAEHARGAVMPTRGAAAVRKALVHLRQNCTEGYDLARLAEAAGCHPHYLVHAFTQEIGVPPSVYQSRILVARTCRALVESPHRPLQLIAQDVGWPGRKADADSQSASDIDRTGILIRHFRRALGTTPDQFRATLRKDGEG
jgi:AraC-like DNA-binding protein